MRLTGRLLLNDLSQYEVKGKATVLSCLLRLFLRMVTAWYQRAAKQAGLADAKTGEIAFSPRFGGSLNLNVHFHVVFLDGPGSAGGQ